MARIYIDDIVMIGNESDWVSTTYEVYTDETMSTLLYQSTEDYLEKEFKVVTLMYPNGELYPPELGSYARMRLFLENGTYSRWYGATCS